jgi:alpha-beta hydrolase superfamily lysophospholipase
MSGGAGERIELEGTEGRISIRVWPRDDPARVVVVAHGYGEHVDRYEHVAQALRARGAEVIGPDHLGHGRSAGDRAVVADMERIVEDLRAVVELAGARAPGSPVVLLGHSMGGLLAIRYAQRFGEELAGLVITGPAVGLGPVISDWLEGKIPDDPIDPAVLSRDPSVGAAYAEDPLVYHGGWKRPTLDAFRRADEAIAAGPGFGALPVLYVHGAADQLVPVDLARPAVQRLGGEDVTERVIDDARHEVFNELDQDETIGLVADFVERVA